MPLRPAFLLTCLMACPVSAGQAVPSPPADAPMPVMTDTMEYCHRLAGMVAAEQRQQTRPHPEAEALAAEGQSLCRAGHVRPGVQRLRSAWWHLKQ